MLTTTAFFLGLTLVEVIPEIPVDIDVKPFFIPVALAVLVPWGKPVLAVAIGGMAGEFLRDMLEGYEPDDALGAVGYVVGFAAAGYLVGQRPLSKVRLVAAALVAAVLHAVIEACALVLFDGELLSIAVYSAAGNVVGDGILLGALPLLPVVPLLYGRIDRYLGYEPRGYEHYGSRKPAVPRPRLEPLPEPAPESSSESSSESSPESSPGPSSDDRGTGGEPPGARGGPDARPAGAGAGATSSAPGGGRP
ncbi:hypothetical protein O2W18_05635 [Modestobacter sp. VKM Ac-2983]|uniref:hypothetical protein n=1 Tax=Modestobacter sp. VKM Ac-2983 TaxID=3004137 RepID=UPI0022ABAA72|nr:hypothetical protein [Modestobacter sp. VKM Ac-2983]MCZ2804577.1 hypothetical protein [Modestobacter sp. VKM Ac-2983]